MKFNFFGLNLQPNLKKEFMIIVPVKEGESVDKALKKYKRKFEKTGIMKELRERKAYKKPSVRRREEIIRAIYIQKLQQGLITKK